MNEKLDFTLTQRQRNTANQKLAIICSKLFLNNHKVVPLYRALNY